MDNKRRTRLYEALNMLSKASAIVDQVCDKEQDCMDNVPENLQGSERFAAMEDAVSSLSDAIEKIDEAVDLVRSAAEK